MHRNPLALVCFLALVAKAAGQTDPTPFTKTVEEHFASWTGKVDRLTAERVNQLLRDPKIKGDQAAALAAIHLYQRSHRNDAGKLDHPVFTRRLMKDHNFEPGFERAQKRLAAPRDVFVHDLPSLAGLKQGPLGDCFFMSPLAAAVHRDPKAVRDMIRPRRDGSYDVVFPDGERFHVPPLTDGMIAMSSSSGGDGLWSSILEEAYGLHRFRALGHRNPTELALDAIDKGGGAKYPIQVLGGHDTDQVVLYHRDGVTDARAERLARELRPILRRADKRLTAAYCVGGNHPPNIVTNHVYAVLGFDAERDLVIVRNPWGHQFEPKDKPAGLKNGYSTKEGIFHVPLDDFVRIFSGVVYETRERLR